MNSSNYRTKGPLLLIDYRGGHLFVSVRGHKVSVGWRVGDGTPRPGDA